MPSQIPQFANVRYYRSLKPDSEKGIRPFMVVTEELNMYGVWHITSALEVLLLKHFRFGGCPSGRDAAITFAVKWDEE